MATILAQCSKLNKELMSRIFSVEFLDKIDDEIENQCPVDTKDRPGRVSTYPRRLRKAMMNLNRMVCICYPEYNVPWFHEKFCIEEANNLRSLSFYDQQMHPLRDDVYQTICSTVGGNRNVRENVYTPYYHFIDFEVWLDTTTAMENGMTNTTGFLPIGKPLPNWNGKKRR